MTNATHTQDLPSMPSWAAESDVADAGSPDEYTSYSSGVLGEMVTLAVDSSVRSESLKVIASQYSIAQNDVPANTPTLEVWRVTEDGMEVLMLLTPEDAHELARLLIAGANVIEPASVDDLKDWITRGATLD